MPRRSADSKIILPVVNSTSVSRITTDRIARIFYARKCFFIQLLRCILKSAPARFRPPGGRWCVGIRAFSALCGIYFLIFAPQYEVKCCVHEHEQARSHRRCQAHFVVACDLKYYRNCGCDYHKAVSGPRP